MSNVHHPTPADDSPEHRPDGEPLVSPEAAATSAPVPEDQPRPTRCARCDGDAGHWPRTIFDGPCCVTHAGPSSVMAAAPKDSASWPVTSVACSAVCAPPNV